MKPSILLLSSTFATILCVPQARAEAPEGDAQAMPSNDEIVVTARGRAEHLADVPMAVTVIKGDSLEKRGNTQTRELFGTVPGLYFSQPLHNLNDEQFYLTLRGVGSSPVVEPSVGLFVDGVYIPNLGWTVDLLDLDRVEVLRGPQGALFGRNTEGGALSIITRRPTSTPRARIIGEAASFDSYRTSAALSGPLGQDWAGGLVGFVSTTQGFAHNVVRNEMQDNRDRWGARLALSGRLGGAEVFLSTDYARSTGRFDTYGDAVSGQVVTIVDPQAPAAQRGTFLRNNSLAGRRYTTYNDAENKVRADSYGFSLQVSANVAGLDATSITAYRAANSDDAYDQDGVATAQSLHKTGTHQRIYSQEFRLASPDVERFSWLVGAYGFAERLRQSRVMTFYGGTPAGPILGSGDGFGIVDDKVEIHRNGIALFAQGKFDVTESLELSVAGRYSYEKVDQDPNLRVRVQIGPSVIVDATNNLARSKAFSGFVPSASLSYKLRPGALAYVSVATGYKGGGFTKEVPNMSSQNQPLKNETSLNYEAGFKGDLFDHRLLISASVFHTKIKDQQLATRVELAPGTGIFLPSTLNVGRGHAKGVEIEGSARPFHGLILTGSLSYTDTKFDDYVASPAAGGLPAYNRAGQQFTEAPRWLASASVAYGFEVGKDTMITPTVSWRHVGKMLIGQGNVSVPFMTVDGYDIVDAQLELRSGPMSIAAFVRNAGDKYYFVNRFELQPATSAPGTRSFARPGPPRQFGVRASYDF